MGGMGRLCDFGLLFLEKGVAATGYWAGLLAGWGMGGRLNWRNRGYTYLAYGGSIGYPKAIGKGIIIVVILSRGLTSSS
jgi:hypothetical protein